jgi:hypothetical protein
MNNINNSGTLVIKGFKKLVNFFNINGKQRIHITDHNINDLQRLIDIQSHYNKVRYGMHVAFTKENLYGVIITMVVSKAMNPVQVESIHLLMDTLTWVSKDIIDTIDSAMPIHSNPEIYVTNSYGNPFKATNIMEFINKNKVCISITDLLPLNEWHKSTDAFNMNQLKSNVENILPFNWYVRDIYYSEEVFEDNQYSLENFDALDTISTISSIVWPIFIIGIGFTKVYIMLGYGV